MPNDTAAPKENKNIGTLTIVNCEHCGGTHHYDLTNLEAGGWDRTRSCYFIFVTCPRTKGTIRLFEFED